MLYICFLKTDKIQAASCSFIKQKRHLPTYVKRCLLNKTLSLKIYFLYKSIEKATGATPGKGFTKTPKESHAIASSAHSIYEGNKICKRDEAF